MVLVMAALAICAVTAALLKDRTDTQAPLPATPDQAPPEDLWDDPADRTGDQTRASCILPAPRTCSATPRTGRTGDARSSSQPGRSYRWCAEGRFRAVGSWADRGCGDTQMSAFGAWGGGLGDRASRGDGSYGPWCWRAGPGHRRTLLAAGRRALLPGRAGPASGACLDTGVRTPVHALARRGRPGCSWMVGRGGGPALEPDLPGPDSPAVDPGRRVILDDLGERVAAGRAAEHDAGALVDVSGADRPGCAAAAAGPDRGCHLGGEHLLEEACDRVPVQHQVVHVTLRW